MYTIYHIPGKKIGVTRNLNSRVTEQQGYAPDEYEVLLTSDDIDYISTMEIELQKSYGYKVDRQTYKNLINKRNKMNINATEQTSTFPFPLNKLKGNLMDNVGVKWSTDHGEFRLDPQTINWIMDNAKVSMFNDARSYVYNKAFSEFLEKVKLHNEPLNLIGGLTMPGLYESNRPVFDNIRTWAKDRGIYKTGDSKTQYVKLMEEAGELAQALLKKDNPEIVDAIGDMVVVLTNLAELEGYRIEDCIQSAYNVIRSRQGKMINGTFVKDENSTTTTTSNKFNNFSTNTL
jgi:NTP pyrophosphatase (non-canonical NTP hydrolase)